MYIKPCLMLYCSAVTTKISTIIRSNKHILTGFPKLNYLDPYENAIGFTQVTRVGSSKFKTSFGKIMEDIYNTSEHFNKFEKNNNLGITGCDGFNDSTYFECKSRWNTMKASMTFKEIESKVVSSIRDNKNFKLLILNDKMNFLTEGRDIPLHHGHNLKNVENILGYNSDKHRWVSGRHVYKLLWPNEYEEVEKTILQELHCLSGSL